MLSLRRYYLDRYLEEHKHFIKGEVLDVGGKKVNKRGSFIPPIDQVISWKYLNKDGSTKPDFCSNADSIPLNENSINTIIMCEVLEYLSEPIKVFHEIHRILISDGYILLSTPFLNPIHGDYWADRARYTPVMLKEMIELCGLKIVKMEPMGSVGAVIYDTLRASIGYASKNDGIRLLLFSLSIFRPFFQILDKICSHQKKFINTGYFLILGKFE